MDATEHARADAPADAAFSSYRSAGGHAAAVVKSVPEYLDEFINRIREENK